MKEEILKKIDYTLLKQSSTLEDIKKLCNDAIKCNTASVCIPPCYVKQAKEYVGIDMVINIGKLKEKNYDYILNEINGVKTKCKGRVLKVIIETCLLTEEEKIKMCELISSSDADYIKTSTGFSKSGATLEDIELFKKHIINGKKIKAAGGIKNFEDAERFIQAGADRLGTSGLVSEVKT